MAEAERRAEIARLNDVVRFSGKGGRLFMTSGFDALSAIEKLLILTEVRCFDAFTPDNDPHGEHDCAALTFGEHRIIWKIDYLPANGFEEADPADPETVLRVLTVMLAEEY
ncbi:DUF3768 domain-containing protein [Novosphingobium sediminicola]|uniref:DUF3768 domain-containing protein n=1 Tax=Novosphingobium sediminicola TaxID=563162 RepID=A0A7W6CQQ4_9SPHN|nr:DUF3768 domain-containing protein [Novosphingobium sediminicola]MBB3955942.1 hypothetical protein [Novosphingobium sediminicola]